MSNPSNSLLDNLPLPFRVFLEQVGSFATQQGSRAYLVGGPVRDLLLGRQLTDLDIVFTTEATNLVKEMSKRWTEDFPGTPSPTAPRFFKKYGTAKLIFREDVVPGIRALDFSTARKEVYTHSGAQPIVSAGTMEDDLARRDFSVTAMALGLYGDEQGWLLDHFQGQADLSARVLRVLHSDSFVDDPARTLRAVRFMARFGFSLSEETRSLFDVAIGENYLGRLPTFRLFDEFRKTLIDEANIAALRLLEGYGALGQVLPGLAVPTTLEILQSETVVRSHVSNWLRLLVVLAQAVPQASLVQFLGYGRLGEDVIEHTLALHRALNAKEV